MDGFSQELLVTLAEVEAIKKNLKLIVEENTTLRLENDKLRERLGEVEKTSSPKFHRNGRENLQRIYNDGFHVCTDSYGQRRENDEECISVMNCYLGSKHADFNEVFKGDRATGTLFFSANPNWQSG